MFNDIHGYYTPNYHSNDKNQNKTRDPNTFYYLSKSEYNFIRYTNSLGYSDKEWNTSKKPNTIRIICLGDSFTEGDGADYNNSYTNILEKKLSSKYSNIEILNAGTCGSDPFINFRNLKELLINYQPDIVLQSFTTNDYYQDFVIRGGNERFQSDGTLKYRKSQWWEKIYAYNYIFRILIHTIGKYDSFFLREDDYKEIYSEINSKTIDLFKEYQSFANRNNFKLIIYTIPFSNHLTGSKENDDFYQHFKNAFSPYQIDFQNLSSCYQNYISMNQTNSKDYYWKYDGHHNAKGYEMMAHCIEDILTPYLDKTNK